ncbi:HNH endonuclease [Chloroflexi bacterium TSY]|nr:HNH endonuclease [Chloroflexi bacterium TSY]
MTSFYISVELRERIRHIDKGICAYCHTSEENSGIPPAHDHIVPQSQHGQTEFNNLCHICRPCNEYKGDTTQALDPVSGEVVALFHPRRQIWLEHFEWSSDGTELISRTAIGRATIIALRMNNATIVGARRRWVSAGWHPPEG